MSKSILLTGFSFLASITLLGGAAFGSSPPQENQPSKVVPEQAPKVVPGENEPVCYEQTTSDTTLNLSSLCNQTPKDSQVRPTPTRTPTPYNPTSIKKFNDEVYGKDG